MKFQTSAAAGFYVSAFLALFGLNVGVVALPVAVLFGLDVAAIPLKAAAALILAALVLFILLMLVNVVQIAHEAVKEGWQ